MKFFFLKHGFFPISFFGWIYTLHQSCSVQAIIETQSSISLQCSQRASAGMAYHILFSTMDSSILMLP